MGNSRIRGLVEGMHQLSQALETGVHTEERLEAAKVYQLSNIHQATYMIDPEQAGNDDIKKFITPREPDRQELLQRTRWQSAIQNDTRWSDEGIDCRRSEGSESESEAEERITDRYILTLNDQRVLLHDYLGEEREAVIKRLHGIEEEELPDPEHAARPRFRWQKTGSAMMRRSREEFGGSLNLDEMGLGKTTQTIDAIMMDGKKPNDAFSLVITEKAVLSSWAKEGTVSYTQGNRPRAIILDDASITFADLWEADYDIAFISYAATMHQYRRLKRFKRFMAIWQQCGLKEAKKVAEEERLPMKRPTAPLFSALTYMLPIRIKSKTLDEGHRLKKWSGKQREAVQKIITAEVDIVTGTPCGNVWTDILAMCDLLPYEGIRSRHEYFKVFAPDQEHSRHKPPTPTQMSNLIRYLLSFSFGRTIDQLDIPGIIYEDDCEFSLSDRASERTLWLIDRFIRLARMNEDDKALDENELNSAMGFCTRAEQESSFPILAEYSPKQEKAFKDKPLNVAKARELFAAAVMKEKHQDEDEDDIVGSRRSPQWADADLTNPTSSAYTTKMTKWLLEEGFASLNALSVTEPKARPERSRRTEFEDFGLDEYDPNSVEDDAMELMEDEDDEEPPNAGGIGKKRNEAKEQAKIRKIKRSRLVKFQENVSKMEDIHIFTPRCEALLALYSRITRLYPGQKIIVWSRFFQALTLVKEAFRRRYNITTPIYSGILDSSERNIMLGQWENSHLTPAATPILFQAKAGGTGLTINAASQVIQLEPWWNIQDSLQAERRCIRLGQEKVVHVWKIFASNSFADAIIRAGGVRKLRIIDRIMAALRTPKGEKVKIPKLITQYARGRLPYTDYYSFRKMDEEALREVDEKRAASKAAGKSRVEEGGQVGQGASEKRPRLASYAEADPYVDMEENMEDIRGEAMEEDFMDGSG